MHKNIRIDKWGGLISVKSQVLWHRSGAETMIVTYYCRQLYFLIAAIFPNKFSRSFFRARDFLGNSAAAAIFPSSTNSCDTGQKKLSTGTTTERNQQF